METIRNVIQQIQTLLEDKKDLKAQYTVSKTETREITMENGTFTLFRTLFDQQVDLKVINEQKPGSIKINKFDETSLKEAIDNAITVSESGTPEEYFDIAPGMEPASFTLGCVEPDIDGLMQRASEFAKEIADRHPKVLVMQLILTHIKREEIYSNTNKSHDETTSGCYTMVIEYSGNDGIHSTGIATSQVQFDKLDVPFMELGNIDKELQNAEDSLNPLSFEGKYEGKVIFTPMCTAQLLTMGFRVMASDAVILDGSSLWSGKVGQKVASSLVTVGMKPWDPRIINHEVHTTDGFRAEDYLILEEGVLKSYMASLYVSNKCNVSRAGNSDLDLVMEAGDTPLSDMIGGIEKGLIVGDISCGMPTASAEISGVAKNAFYIENGAIKGPVNETMISFNLKDMLLNVKALSKELLMDGGIVVPYMLVDKILISGK